MDVSTMKYYEVSIGSSTRKMFKKYTSENHLFIGFSNSSNLCWVFCINQKDNWLSL